MVRKTRHGNYSSKVKNKLVNLNCNVVEKICIKMTEDIFSSTHLISSRIIFMSFIVTYDILLNINYKV